MPRAIRSLHVLWLIVLWLPVAPYANASEAYIALDYLSSEYEAMDPGTDPLRPPALSIGYGRNLSSHVALEARAGWGIGSDDDQGPPGTTVDVSIDSVLALYLRAATAPSRDVMIYALAGMTRTDLSVDASPSSPVITDFQETDLSLGVGVHADISDRLGLSVEYLQIADTGSFDLSALTLGLRFGL